MLVAAVFRLPRLGRPAEEVFDEVYHAKTAQQYLDGVPPTEWVHPPTAKLLIAVPVYFFGYKPWAWRLAPALRGHPARAGVLPARAPRARERAGRAAGGAAAAVRRRVPGAEPDRDDQHLRGAVPGERGVLPVACQPGRAPAERADAAHGLMLGLALSTRWTSLWAWAFLALTLLVVRRLRLLQPREMLLAFLAFVAIPISLYVLSYVPWMLQGRTTNRCARCRSTPATSGTTTPGWWPSIPISASGTRGPGWCVRPGTTTSRSATS
jgi:hypothetical protein